MVRDLRLREWIDKIRPIMGLKCRSIKKISKKQRDKIRPIMGLKSIRSI